MFLQIVLKLFINFCPPKFIEECNRLLPEGVADYPDGWALRALHASLNDACTRTVRKWLKKNSGHLIILQIWIPWRYHVWGATHEAILKSSSRAQNSFWIKSLTGEDVEQFSAGSINKAIPSFRNSLTRVCEGWWKTFWVFFCTQKSCAHNIWCHIVPEWARQPTSRRRKTSYQNCEESNIGKPLCFILPAWRYA